MEAEQAGSTQSIPRIGDCEAPAPLLSISSVWRYAVEFDDSSGINSSFKGM